MLLKGVYQRSGATLKSWLTPKSWSTPGEKVIFVKKILFCSVSDGKSCFSAEHPLAGQNTQEMIHEDHSHISNQQYDSGELGGLICVRLALLVIG